VSNSLSSIKLAAYPAAAALDHQLKWAVVVSRYENKWLLVKHKARSTFESPGGKREAGESIIECAERELYEETGALRFNLHALAPYSIKLPNGELSYGQLFFANIDEIGPLPESEIEGVHLFTEVPKNHTYPNVHPFLIDVVKEAFSISTL
jgi:8-oxo-dGTP diphosphatase